MTISLQRCILVFVFTFGIYGCATTKGYENLLSSWVGASDLDLIRVWGPPINTYEISSSKFLVYQSKRNVYLPGTAPTITTQVIGNTAYTNSYGGSAAMNIGLNCQTTFEIVNSKVVSWSWKGNDCTAIDQTPTTAKAEKTDKQNFAEPSPVESSITTQQNSEAQAWNEKSFSSASTKNWTEGIRTSTVAIKLNPNFTAAYINRCWSYIGYGDLEEAQKDCSEALRLEPNNAIALNNQGVIFESKDKLLASKNYEKSCLLGYETACKNFEKINGYSPKEKSKSVEKLLTEANLKFANRDWQSVIALTSKAIEIDPKNSEAYSTRSGAYANSGNLDAAKTDAELAIQYNPNNAVGFNNLGFVFEMRKDTKQSLLQYAIACNMKFELACSNLKRIKGN